MCIFVWVSIMLIIVISGGQIMNGKKNLALLLAHLPRCWMSEYQQLARFVCWFLTKKQASRRSFKFRILLMYGVYFSFKSKHIYRSDIMSPSSNYLCSILSSLSACGSGTIFIFLSHVGELLALPAASPSTPCHHVCHLSVREEFWHCPDEPADSCWDVVSNFHHQEGLPARSVELKCVSVHFKWPCWSPRCLVKPVKMACPPSPALADAVSQSHALAVTS